MGRSIPLRLPSHFHFKAEVKFGGRLDMESCGMAKMYPWSNHHSLVLTWLCSCKEWRGGPLNSVAQLSSTQKMQIIISSQHIYKIHCKTPWKNSYVHVKIIKASTGCWRAHHSEGQCVFCIHFVSFLISFSRTTQPLARTKEICF